ncbi:AAA family ATPase [Floccifex sp.]|uniref:cytidylate kinase-like family protein n=1 Tax=Floccifex sp. TaxID=2815810 RepID=UPI003F0DCDFD
MKKVICIGREFGSGGHEIAILLSKELGIKVYEKHLLYLACSYGEMSIKTLESSDEKVTNPYLFQTVHEGNHHVTRGLPTSEVLFYLQSHEIRELAKKDNCIFVGRCANFVLRNEDVKVISVFIHAPKEMRIQRKMKQENLSYKKAIRLVEKMDLQRKKYYEHYTKSKWGDPFQYDIYIDLESMSMEDAVQLICAKYKG